MVLRLTVTPPASLPGDFIRLSIRQTHPAERDKRIEACPGHRYDEKWVHAV